MQITCHLIHQIALTILKLVQYTAQLVFAIMHADAQRANDKRIAYQTTDTLQSIISGRFSSSQRAVTLHVCALQD